MRVLVTGASGFIGSHLVPRLVGDGLEVHAVSSQPATDSEHVTWHQADLLADGAATELVRAVRPTLVVGLAWAVGQEERKDMSCNRAWLNSSSELIDASLDNGAERIVFSGSCLEHDWPLVSGARPTAAEPHSAYTVARRELLGQLVARCTDSALSWAWGRIFFAYGPGEPATKLVSSVGLAAKSAELVEILNPSELRDFVFVDDVADALVALTQGSVSRAVDIGSGTATSVADIAALTLELAGGSEEQLVFGTSNHDPTVVQANPEPLLRDFGCPVRTPLGQGIKATLHSLPEASPTT